VWNGLSDAMAAGATAGSPLGAGSDDRRLHHSIFHRPLTSSVAPPPSPAFAQRIFWGRCAVSLGVVPVLVVLASTGQLLPPAGKGKLRLELFNRELFLSLEKARWVIDHWRIDYNHHRPHSTLEYQTSAAFAAGCGLEG